MRNSSNIGGDDDDDYDNDNDYDDYDNDLAPWHGLS